MNNSQLVCLTVHSWTISADDGRLSIVLLRLLLHSDKRSSSSSSCKQHSHIHKHTTVLNKNKTRPKGNNVLNMPNKTIFSHQREHRTEHNNIQIFDAISRVKEVDPICKKYPSYCHNNNLNSIFRDQPIPDMRVVLENV